MIRCDYASLIMYSYTIDSAQQGPSVWLLGRPICVCLSPLNMSYFAGPAVVLLSYICFILQVQQLSYCLIFVYFAGPAVVLLSYICFILQVQQLSYCLIFVLFCRSCSCLIVLSLFYFTGPVLVLLF